MIAVNATKIDTTIGSVFF